MLKADLRHLNLVLQLASRTLALLVGECASILIWTACSNVRQYGARCQQLATTHIISRRQLNKINCLLRGVGR